MRALSILGSTGSIGCNTVSLVGPRVAAGAARVVALTGGRNIALLARQARDLRAEVAVTSEPALLADLRAALAGSDVEAAAGPAALCQAAARPADWTMSAIVGAAGIAPGMAALSQGGTLALANKETMVAAGAAVHAAAAASGAVILPVDSEHSAIFQLMAGRPDTRPERVILTASGGPFRQLTLAQMAQKSAREAVAHPNWDMGQRISIDSASMFNKALELVEAKELFHLAPDQLEVIVHPQSIIHAIVGYSDGGLLAHLGPPDMRHAIGYALDWPGDADLPVERLDFAALGRLDFEAPDEARFPALRLARAVMARGGLAAAAFNGAKEAALDAFIAGAIRFTDMAPVVERVLDRMDAGGDLDMATITLEDALNADRVARVAAHDYIALAQAS